MNDVKVIREAIPLDFANYLALQTDLWMQFTAGENTDPNILVSNAVGWYSPIFLESLLVHLQPLIEKHSGK